MKRSTPGMVPSRFREVPGIRIIENHSPVWLRCEVRDPESGFRAIVTVAPEWWNTPGIPERHRDDALKVIAKEVERDRTFALDRLAL